MGKFITKAIIPLHHLELMHKPAAIDMLTLEINKSRDRFFPTKDLLTKIYVDTILSTEYLVIEVTLQIKD